MKKQHKIILVLLSIFLLFPCLLLKFIFVFAKKEQKAFHQDRYYEWKYGKIHYTVHGHGRPLLLVHGICIGAGHHEWQKNVEELSKSYQVYCIDLLGFGFSDRPKMTYTAYLYALLLNDFIRDIVKRPVCAVGSSSSSAFLIMACRLHPKNFNKLLLVAPTGIHEPLADKNSKWKRRLLELPMIGTGIYCAMASKKYCKLFLEKFCFYAKESCISPQLVKTYYAFAHLGGSSNQYPIASFLCKYMSIDIKAAYHDLKLPICIVWGENSQINPVTHMEILEELKPQANYVIFEETRLLPHYENASEFNHLVKEFFK